MHEPGVTAVSKQQEDAWRNLDLKHSKTQASSRDYFRLKSTSNRLSGAALVNVFLI